MIVVIDKQSSSVKTVISDAPLGANTFSENDFEIETHDPELIEAFNHGIPILYDASNESLYFEGELPLDPVTSLEVEVSDLWYDTMLKNARLKQQDSEIADVWYTIMIGGV